MRGDPKGEVLRAFGVRIPVLGLARRVTFVIGKDRKVRAVHESQFDAESHAAQACAFVRRARA
jgi:peroxiredoxin